MSVKNARCAFCFFLVLVASACGSMSKAEAVAEMKAEQQQAHELIQAIDIYKQEQGHFPKGLSMLVPTYLTNIPLTTQGQDFIYERSRLDDYNLCFYLPRKKNWGCCYLRRLEGWDCFYNFGD